MCTRAICPLALFRFVTLLGPTPYAGTRTSEPYSQTLTLHLATYTPHPTPYTPAPYTLHPAPYTLPPAPIPRTLNPMPRTLHPSPCTLHPAPCTLHPAHLEQCIREWRSVNTLDKQVKRSCPLCRARSNLCTYKGAHARIHISGCTYKDTRVRMSIEGYVCMGTHIRTLIICVAHTRTHI